MNAGRTRGIGQNSIFNLFTQLLVSVVAFLAIPLVISRLGTEQYGLLSLLWLLIGYFGILDAGISQSSTKYIAEELGRNDRESAAAVAKSSLFLASVVGVAAGVAILGFSFVSFERFINIPEAMAADAVLCLRLIALILPLVVVQGTLKSIPTAFNRFDVVNMVQGTGGLFQWGGAVAVLYAGGGLVALVSWMLAVRAGTCIWYYGAGLRLMPELRHPSSPGYRTKVRRLLAFGGWVAVPQIMTPIIVFTERLLVSSILTLSWLSFYSVPYDALIRLLVIPISLVSAMFPYMSSQWQQEGARSQVAVVYQRAIKFLTVILVPIVLMLMVFSHDILRIWLSVEFANKSHWVLILCSAGIMLNSLAQIPNTALYAMGRPDINAKLLLLEFPLYVLLCWQLTVHYGIIGTAAGWLVRIVVETVILFVYASKIMGQASAGNVLRNARKEAVVVVICSALLVFLQLITDSFAFRVSASLAFLLMYTAFSWIRILDDDDREVIRRLIPAGSMMS